MELTAEEVRVLGCLVEKQLTTPQAYPLTENALVAACNQLTNRDPIVAYSGGVVRRALVSLRQEGLASFAHGGRADRHSHRLEEALQLQPAEVAVLAVLMLRGPQTTGELRARTERMHSFASVEEVETAIDALAAKREPLVERLARAPGQKEARVRDTLAPWDPSAVPVPAADTGDEGPRPASVRDEIAALRADLESLRAQVVALESQQR